MKKIILGSFFVLFFLLFMVDVNLAQETSVKLKTADSTSSFNILDINDISILKIGADGKVGIKNPSPIAELDVNGKVNTDLLTSGNINVSDSILTSALISSTVDVNGVVNAAGFIGDGSGLTNVRPMANYKGGNLMCPITANYGNYQNVKNVTLNIPGPGRVIVIASGYVRWESKGWDLCLLGLVSSFEGDPNSSWSAENTWYNHLNILTDYNCVDSSDQYTSFTNHRGFNVNAGTHTFTLWANKYSSASKTRVDDVNISAMYFPTGGAYGVQYVSSDMEEKEKSQNEILTNSIDGSTPVNQSGKEKKNPEERIMALEKELADLKKQLIQVLENQKNN